METTLRQEWEMNIMQYYTISIGLLGAVHKKTSAVRGGVCPVRTFCEQRGGVFFRCGRPHFFVQKTSGFSKFMGFRTNKGIEPVRAFCRQGRGIFRDFVRFLWTTSYENDGLIP